MEREQRERVREKSHIPGNSASREQQQREESSGDSYYIHPKSRLTNTNIVTLIQASSRCRSNFLHVFIIISITIFSSFAPPSSNNNTTFVSGSSSERFATSRISTSSNESNVSPAISHNLVSPSRPTNKFESSGLSLKDIVEQVDSTSDVKDNPVMLYMKGVPDLPRCGFSSLAVRVLKEYSYYGILTIDMPFADVPLSARNILEDPELKNVVKAYSLTGTISSSTQTRDCQVATHTVSWSILAATGPYFHKYLSMGNSSEDQTSFSTCTRHRNRVGIIVAKGLVKNVVAVIRKGDRIMLVKLVI
ncbi:hypothetical protein HYC85_003281 [Camellia sinensis]|uniref:Glutaredoxin domain-containing protein n=1 Tax=Camellia sinensis TaxID=4442 RepID=A0A7J7IAW2_CAMSI|nr:hypothetical protein HYC85_003281 [Camellia sinensis]